MKRSLIDEADIVVESGSGGEGSVHFRRARFLPKGGPDGGDGGRGGDVVITARENLSDLSNYLHKTHFKAPSGMPGGANQRHGRDGTPLELPVPVGTQVFERDTEELLCDLDAPEMRYVVARGGKGGKGNVHYKTPVRQAPRIAQKGMPGRRIPLRLVYKMMTDVGVLGPANTGKSLFLSRITSAKPKIAPYPFTTRLPQLGVYFTDVGDPLTFVEVPALDVAPERRFLKHVERTRALLFFLDVTQFQDDREALNAWSSLQARIQEYGQGLTGKPGFLVLNKIDAVEERERVDSLLRFLRKKTGMPVFAISVKTGEGIEDVLKVVVASCTVEVS